MTKLGHLSHSQTQSRSDSEASFPLRSASSAILPDSVEFVNLLQLIEVSGNDFFCKLCNASGSLDESAGHLETEHGIKITHSQESSVAASSIGVREDSSSSAATFPVSSLEEQASEIAVSVPLSSTNSHSNPASSSPQDINPVSSSSAGERGNIHLNRNWKTEMVSSFKEEIVPGWRRETREAWRDNQVFDVKDRKLFIQIQRRRTSGKSLRTCC